MKKLALIVGIVAISTLMSASMALAQGYIAGTWEMISSGICLHSVDGWERSVPATDGFNGWKPVTPTKVWAGTATARATWVFKQDGKGTVQGTNYAAIFPGGYKAPYEAPSPFGFNFEYEITNGYEVTVTGTSGSANGLVMNGMISIDKKVMTLLSASNVQNFSAWGLGYLIMDNMRILIKVGN
jgi:hypothetical protein